MYLLSIENIPSSTFIYIGINMDLTGLGPKSACLNCRGALISRMLRMGMMAEE
jgi:hypothetical protein